MERCAAKSFCKRHLRQSNAVGSNRLGESVKERQRSFKLVATIAVIHMHVFRKLDCREGSLEPVNGFKRVRTNQESVAIDLHLIRYRTNSKLAEYFGRDDGGHESSVVNHEFNINHEFNGDASYHFNWHDCTNKPWLVLLT